MNIQELCQKAKKSSKTLSGASTASKNEALTVLAELIESSQDVILEANQKDIDAAKEDDMAPALLDRLVLAGRLEGIANDVRKIASLKDPIGEVFDEQTLPNGLKVSKRRTPIGVLGVIYEARPNVTIDTAALALKTGNCVVLRGGSETIRTNQALVALIHQALGKSGLPTDAVQFINNPDRSLVLEMLKMHECIDMIIPRGAEKLHQFCRENSLIPVITGGIGICHLFLDEEADLEKSLQVILNAKTQRPTVCNALDTLLVHQAVAKKFLPEVVHLLSAKGVELRLDSEAMRLVPQAENILEAGKGDWDKEWLSLTLGIQIVGSLKEAIAHIQEHSTGHSDGILTENKENARIFLKEIDSAAVYHNASTRFTDGGALGLGAEVAISTQKLHARGPMGLQELTTYKWIIEGNYQVREG